jgi:hypothetical protein
MAHRNEQQGGLQDATWGVSSGASAGGHEWVCSHRSPLQCLVENGRTARWITE